MTAGEKISKEVQEKELSFEGVQAEVFADLYSKNVSDYVESKGGLNYLSWASAWAEVKKKYPTAEYTIERFGEEKKPYLYDEALGYMVFTTVTIEDLTHEMWLPVMDFNNNAMKDRPYEIQTKYKTLTIQPATMFDINKAVMRCLTKNLAMFGLGLYIYKGEDLPEERPEEKVIFFCEEPSCNNAIEGNDRQTAEQVRSSSKKFLGKEYCLTHFYELAKAKKAEEDKKVKEEADTEQARETEQITLEEEVEE